MSNRIQMMRSVVTIIKAISIVLSIHTSQGGLVIIERIILFQKGMLSPVTRHHPNAAKIKRNKKCKDD